MNYYRNSSFPNQHGLEAALAQLEATEASAVAGSGMAALFAAFSAVVKAGDHIIADRSLYGGTHTLLTRQLSRFGVETSFVDLDDADAIRKAHRPSTKVLHAETLSNPLIRVGNLRRLAEIAHSWNWFSLWTQPLARPRYAVLASGAPISSFTLRPNTLEGIAMLWAALCQDAAI